MLKKSLEKVLNEQINAELHSAYLYLSMSAWFLEQGLAGYANWMRVQFQEELAHGTHIFDYICERGGKVTLTPIPAVEVEFAGITNIFEKALAHEQKITGMINNLMDVATKESDHATQSFLKWYIDEQVEEEANAEQILYNLKLIKGEGQGLLMMDRELQARVFVDPFAGLKNA
jgi:ferritin